MAGSRWSLDSVATFCCEMMCLQCGLYCLTVPVYASCSLSMVIPLLYTTLLSLLLLLLPKQGGYVFTSVCLPVSSKLLKKFWNGFWQNLLEGWGMPQWSNDYILVAIWITICIQEFFKLWKMESPSGGLCSLTASIYCYYFLILQWAGHCAPASQNTFI